MLAVYLATQHYQEPPEEQITGVPRTAFFTSRSQLDRVAALLDARGHPYEGPVDHPPSVPLSASLYFRDLSGNFLELCTPRGGAGAQQQ
jgi:catechol-2,3-dioxygenase